MKLVTTPQETARLMKMGCPFPQSLQYAWGITRDEAYSIGELIDFLPKKIEGADLDIFTGRSQWFVRYENRRMNPCAAVRQWESRELVDALYDAVVKLKEEGVI